MDRAASSTEQQLEALARLVAAERNVEKAAHHAYIFIRRLIEELLEALPDQTETISAAFQAITPRLRPRSAADPSTFSNARPGGTNKASDSQDTSVVTRADYLRIESVLNPFQSTTASDVQQSNPTICPGEDTRTAFDLSKSKCDESASREQPSLHDRLVIESHGTGGSQHSQHATPSTDFSGSETTMPNNGQVSQEHLLADELDSVAPRPENSSLDDAAEQASIRLSPSPQISSFQAETGMSEGSQSSDPHWAPKLDASVALQKLESRPQQAQGVRHEKQGGVIRLYPTAEQYKNFSTLVMSARELGADRDGLCIVTLPQNGPACSLAPPKDSVKVQMNRFTTHSREDGTFTVIRT
ncbi:hypothetical protein MPH_13811 [Macrophomina phaseolina MS6]|uniref:Uncharacterized protein n=1 Tax=Macrophomina phaseolina (strain MS6) TaxID=1126212 RepID=K2R4Q7_MACPH|nr:hypothetical protein MPH_13811 [Macrophomina phaseolina MS6]